MNYAPDLTNENILVHVGTLAHATAVDTSMNILPNGVMWGATIVKVPEGIEVGRFITIEYKVQCAGEVAG